MTDKLRDVTHTPDPDPADIIAGALQTSRAHAYELMRKALAQQDAQTNHCPTCKRTDGDMCDWCPSMQQAAQAASQGDDFSQCKPPMRHIPGVRVELLRKAATAAPTPPAQQGEEFWPAPLSEFKEGQWWIAELDAMASSVNATDEQKRAVSVVHHFLASAEKVAATPPAQRVMLTDEEIEQASVKGDGTHSGFARAIIEAYEKKNGIK